MKANRRRLIAASRTLLGLLVIVGVLRPFSDSAIAAQHRPMGDQIGIAEGGRLTALSPIDLASRLDAIAALGATWIRQDLNWDDVQHDGPDSYNWTNFDRVVEFANERGLRVLGILAYTPPWARPSGCDNEKCPPASRTKFAEFAAAAAARYAGQVQAWEIWNEPNLAAYWSPAADPDNYVRLLRVTATAIRGADPNAIIVSGGVAPTATGSGNLDPLAFLTEMYAAGAQTSFDALGFHPYSFPVLPSYDAPWNNWQRMADTATSVRSIMLEYGDEAKKVWITEFGAPTNGPGTAANGDVNQLGPSPTHVDEQLQAEMATEAVDLWSSYSWAGVLFWYCYLDTGTSTDSNENFFGLVRADGTPKPALDAFREAIAGGS